MKKAYENNHITPGILLSVIEEFDAGKNTYVDEGDVRSSVIGGSTVDFSDRILNVKQKNPPMIPKIGDIVLGYIDMLFGNMISVRILYINEKFSKSGFSAIASTRMFYSGGNYNSNWRERSYKSKYIFKVGDIIRGKVYSLLNSSIHLTLDDKDLGVVYTICFSCGNEFTKVPGGLKCNSCGNFEDRKVSIDYGKDSFTLLYDKQFLNL
ncbi:MAG TPA: exosome complex RNA-binding protein Csl4 [Candidatus Saccharimonadales bacterium]|nr:exosome complex RNA-binding protein Csl4 [Candidatus Saccharimonadales bacterium]